MDVKNNEGYTNIPEAVAVFRVDRERERLAWIRRKRAGRAIFLVKLFLDFVDMSYLEGYPRRKGNRIILQIGGF